MFMFNNVRPVRSHIWKTCIQDTYILSKLIMKSKLICSTIKLTGNLEAGQSLLWSRWVHVKNACVAALISEAHPLDGDSWGVFRGRGKLHMLLPAHAVSLAGLVTQQGLVLDIQPTHLP